MTGRARLLAWAGALVFAGALTGLGLLFAHSGLEAADQLASVIGAFVGVTGLALSLYGTLAARRGRRAPTGPPEPAARVGKVSNTVDGTTVRGDVTQARRFGPAHAGADADEGGDTENRISGGTVEGSVIQAREVRREVRGRGTARTEDER